MSRVTTFLERLRNIGWRIPVGALALAALIASPWWGPRLLSQLGYFHVRQVEIYGAVYAQPSRIISRMQVDTTMSIWMNLAPLERRVARDPQVRSVAIERKLPGTLVVRMVENAPVALVESSGTTGKGGSGNAVRVVDGTGHALPIDPSRTNIDLPVVESADPSVLKLLADVKAREPRLFAQISSVRHASRFAAGSGARASASDELDVVLPSVMVRALVGVSAERLADVIPVEADLARRHARVAELDLRFRDQVIARLQ
ncbi:MAG TPA: FtsQ-type POTRA domain-containing protein [Gemmatimonadaceae bacterium]|nr:FtsQ-type POTRA domain-containing protein [Gemmatimonadaceae bacterium]